MHCSTFYFSALAQAATKDPPCVRLGAYTIGADVMPFQRLNLRSGCQHAQVLGEGTFPGLYNTQQLAVPSYDREKGRGRERHHLSLLVVLIQALVPFMGLYSHDLITPFPKALLPKTIIL